MNFHISPVNMTLMAKEGNNISYKINRLMLASAKSIPSPLALNQGKLYFA